MRDLYQERSATRRDLIWALLWALDNRGWANEGWVTSRQVYDRWRDGRSECGIAWQGDWIGPTSHFTYQLNRLVAEGRAEKRKLPGKHPTYRAVTT
jgi:hypothetical protein